MPKQAFAKQLIADNRISILGLLETRVKQAKASKISKNICHSWNWAFNYDTHINGRIWVGWNPNIWNLDVIFVSSQVIHCKVQSVDLFSTTFLLSFVYGLNSYLERRDLWHDLISISPPISWCMLGDFNVIKDLSETNNDNVSWDIGMEDFKSCINSVGIDDIRGVGPMFTWSNMQLARPVHKKLDRAMGNSGWFTNFSMSHVTYAPRGLSDHSLVLLRTGIQLPQSKR